MQAAGSHELWFHPARKIFTTIPNYPGDMPSFPALLLICTRLALLIESVRIKSCQAMGLPGSLVLVSLHTFEQFVQAIQNSFFGFHYLLMTLLRGIMVSS